MTQAFVTRVDARLDRDPRRVLARLFVPGHEITLDQESRATGVLGRVLALTEAEVADALARVHARYDSRHRDLPATFARHYAQIVHRIPPEAPRSPARCELIGALFTHEFSLEGAALFNPSAVAHPNQSGLGAGELRFVLSLRAVGEGHLSSVELRSGVLGADGEVELDSTTTHVEEGEVGPSTYRRAQLAQQLREEGADGESTRFLLSRLPAELDDDDLAGALTALAGQALTRHGGARTEEIVRSVARASYTVTFSEASTLAERVLWPQAPGESRGMEDARFVRFVADDGAVRYLATYTAFDGSRIAGQRIETVDFRTFSISPLTGPAGRDKGLALFPRPVGGRLLALSRWDRETCSLAVADAAGSWTDAGTVHRPAAAWELVQTGNCGSPIETPAGWLVLTHGVGPMREYAIGALLLDLDDPSIVVGSLAEPLLTPSADERDGYVPNVVYSCGALLHRDRLLLPYGASDDSVRFALVDVPALLERLTGG